MRGRLVYIVGPSGAGKDSVIAWACARLPAQARVRLARRTITRPVQDGGEQHLSVSEPEFGRMLEAGRFAMHWQANGHRYGIDREILSWLDEGMTVVVNGSREHLPCALAGFPALRAVHVGAPPAVIEARLRQRGRENPAEVQARLDRGQALAGAHGRYALEISNEGDLARAGAALLQLLQENTAA